MQERCCLAWDVDKLSSLQTYKQNLGDIRRTYELRVANGANIHTFNTLYTKTLNALTLAERDLRRDGFLPEERKAEIKKHFNTLCEYVGKLTVDQVG